MTRQSSAITFACSLVLATSLAAFEDDYEFLPAYATGGIGSTGANEATSRLVLGYPGQSATPGKNRWLESIDGNGGFDNVAPRLSPEPGPGGLTWDLSPSYRTRYKKGTDYTTSVDNPQGNNWFSSIPYVKTDGSGKYSARFGANEFFVYDKLSGSTYEGDYANDESRFYVSSGNLYDQAGKIITFDTTSGRLEKINGLGNAEIVVTYSGTSSITVTQKSDSTTEVRRFVYTLEASGTRIDKIDVDLKDGASWTTYRTVDFTYHDNVSGAQGSSSGDLIAISDTKDLSESGVSYTRSWAIKYYTGSYKSSSNPGYPYQVESVYGPGSVQSYLADNPTKTLNDMLKSTSSSLSSYVERSYEYHSDRRVRKIVFEDGCGCGGSTGTYEYTWAENGTPPSDLNTWMSQMTVERPDGSARIVDYNLYGETLNSIIQEDADNPSSRRWIRTWRYDSDGRLTDSYSVAACSSYNDTTHAVSFQSPAAGRHMKYAYHGTYGYLQTAKLVDPANSNENYQQKLAWTKKTSGSRERFLLTSSKVYPTETTTDTGGHTTSYSYTYHSGDALAVKKVTTTLPVISTAHNGSGSAFTTKQYFELDGLPTWSLDAEGFVHYTGYDADRRVPTIQVTDIDTDTADRPSGVPAAPETDFQSSDGLNIVTRSEYDDLGRLTKRESPPFDALDVGAGSIVSDNKTTSRVHYSKLADDSLVVLFYEHIDTAYHDAAVSILVSDHEGNSVTTALGDLDDATEDTDLDDDIDETKATLTLAFDGDIIQRTDSVYEGGKLASSSVWSDADNGSADKFTSTNTYDASGRLETSKTPAGTITRYAYDVLGRRISRKVGTVDGGGSDNMTLVEESFYDDEEDSSSNVGDGFLTRRVLYTSYTTETEHPTRTTDFTYDYRGRLIETTEPLDVVSERDYDNLGRVTETRRYDESGTSTLIAKSENFYDAWGQVYESRVYSLPLADTDSDGEDDHLNTLTWRDARGSAIKVLSQGGVFQKTSYDGAGRVTTQAMSYDSSETASPTHATASTIAGDVVVEETRYFYDDAGRVELVGSYQRLHTADDDEVGDLGSLTVGGSGNSRAQYSATWYDEFGRQVTAVAYGTNGGTDLTTRPSGTPPEYSSSSSIVSRLEYTLRGQVEHRIQAGKDPGASPPAHLEWVGEGGTAQRTTYKDWGAVYQEIDNYIDGTPASGTSDDDRTVEYAYNSEGQLQKIIAKEAFEDQDPTPTYTDQVTEYVYGVSRGTATGNSRIESNDQVAKMKFPNPETGLPGGTGDEESYAYNAQGERIYKSLSNTHLYEYDERGRQTHDRATVLEADVDGFVRRIERTYDALDRVEKLTSYSTATGSAGTVRNEVEFEYGKFGVIEKIYQDPAGAVSTSSSPKVEYAWSFPTDGTTALRLTSTTYPDGTQVNEVYDSGTDDVVSRLSGRDLEDGATDIDIFREEYLGAGRRVERALKTNTGGAADTLWTLHHSGDYTGLDRFNRVDELVVKQGSTLRNQYVHSYNVNSQLETREDKIGKIAGVEVFDEKNVFDGLKRLTDRRIGNWNGSTMSNEQKVECWTELEKSGNRKEYSIGTNTLCASNTKISATFNGSNENKTTGFGYLQGGALNDRPNQQEQIFDAWDRFVEFRVWGYTVAAYEYNGLNWKTVRKDESGGGGLPDTYYYYSSNWQLLLEEEISEVTGEGPGDGDTLTWYVWGTQYIDDLVLRADGTAQTDFEFQVQDERFNLLTRLDDSGGVVKRYLQTAYGVPYELPEDYSTMSSPDADLHIFQGRLFHQSVGLYDFRNRFQEPDLGVFVSRDPIGIWEDRANTGNQSIFVASDPVNLFDPSGTFITSTQCAPPFRVSSWGLPLPAVPGVPLSVYRPLLIASATEMLLKKCNLECGLINTTGPRAPIPFVWSYCGTGCAGYISQCTYPPTASNGVFVQLAARPSCTCNCYCMFVEVDFGGGAVIAVGPGGLVIPRLIKTVVEEVVVAEAAGAAIAAVEAVEAAKTVAEIGAIQAGQAALGAVLDAFFGE